MWNTDKVMSTLLPILYRRQDMEAIVLHTSQRITVLDLSNTIPTANYSKEKNPTLFLTKSWIHNLCKYPIFFNQLHGILRKHQVFFTTNLTGYSHKIQNSSSQSNHDSLSQCTLSPSHFFTYCWVNTPYVTHYTCNSVQHIRGMGKVNKLPTPMCFK